MMAKYCLDNPPKSCHTGYTYEYREAIQKDRAEHKLLAAMIQSGLPKIIRRQFVSDFQRGSLSQQQAAENYSLPPVCFPACVGSTFRARRRRFFLLLLFCCLPVPARLHQESLSVVFVIKRRLRNDRNVLSFSRREHEIVSYISDIS